MHVTTVLIKFRSIKVRNPSPILGRRMRNEWSESFFSKVFTIFWKWTFINVHFWKKASEIWKKQCIHHSEHNALNHFFKLKNLLLYFFYNPSDKIWHFWAVNKNADLLTKAPDKKCRFFRHIFLDHIWCIE